MNPSHSSSFLLIYQTKHTFTQLNRQVVAGSCVWIEFKA
jgi:hypothetical protein